MEFTLNFLHLFFYVLYLFSPLLFFLLFIIILLGQIVGKKRKLGLGRFHLLVSYYFHNSWLWGHKANQKTFKDSSSVHCIYLFNLYRDHCFGSNLHSKRGDLCTARFTNNKKNNRYHCAIGNS